LYTKKPVVALQKLIIEGKPYHLLTSNYGNRRKRNFLSSTNDIRKKTCVKIQL